MKTALKIGGYVLFFVLCTAIFLYLTFPTDKAKSFAELQLAERLGAERVEIADLSLAGLGGVTLEGVTVELPALMVPTAVPGADKEGPPRIIAIEELNVDASLSGLLGGEVDVAFDGIVQTGTVKDGRYTQIKGEDGVRHVLEIGEIEGVAFGSEQAFQALVGKDVLGTLGGSLKLSLPMERDKAGRLGPKLDAMQGEIKLLIRDAVLKRPIFDTPMGRMQLTDADLGDIALEVNVDRASELEAFKKTARRGGDNTIIHIAEASVRGDDLDVEVAKNSAITLRPGQTFKDAAVNIHMALRIKDAFFDKEEPDPSDPNKKVTPNKPLRFVMEQNPIKPVLDNGVFGLGITGRLSSPRIRPERSVIRGAFGGPSAARRPKIDRPDPTSPAADGAATSKPTVPRLEPASRRPLPNGPTGDRTWRPIRHPNAPGADGGARTPIVRPTPEPEPEPEPDPMEEEEELPLDGEEELPAEDDEELPPEDGELIDEGELPPEDGEELPPEEGELIEEEPL